MSISPLRSQPVLITNLRKSLPFPATPTPEDPKDKIHQYFSLLNSQVERLDLKVEEILQRHEVDFLSAFKGHIFGLHKEVMEMRRQLEEKDTDLHRNQQIASLSKAVQWMKEEGVKFGEMLRRAKVESEKWKSKAQALEADNGFLERQVKMMKRREKMVFQSLESRQLPEIRKNEPEELASRQLSTKSTSPIRGGEQESKGEVYPSLSDLLAKYGLKDSTLAKDLEELITKLTSAANQTIHHLQTALSRKSKKMHLLTVQNSKNFSTQSELQKLFVDCVEEVRRETGLRPASHLQDEVFLSSDRRKIIELFCLNDAVFQEIYDKLFTPQRESGPQYAIRSTPMLHKRQPQLPIDVNTERYTPIGRKTGFAGLFASSARGLPAGRK